MINVDERPPAEVLMDSLSLVEKADQVVIIIQKEESITVKTTVDYRELKWMLDQVAHVAMNELFGVPREL